MYTLIRILPARTLLLEQLPVLTAAFLVAEAFYKFGSFALECLAFLATWLVLDALVSLYGGMFGWRREAAALHRGP